MIGRTISHFRVLAKIGEGGMGVVYKAEDEKLGRPVALKILPADFASDEERRLRLIREARTAAAVSHPNIAAIHEIDEADGVTFIAMEYVEGKTLRALLGGRALTIKEALRIAAGIAEGLARAHQGRIVHRDLKPENVIIATDGRVKILDFGLAKFLEDRGGGTPSELSRLQTISDDHTREGRIVGTLAYMSPEQARGQTLDSRSDLFSFGIVLYEMVTGRVPFKGSTRMDTLSAIIREPAIPAIDLNPDVPPELQRILGKCLEKEPDDRYHDSRDLVVDLKHLMRDSDSQPMRRSDVSAPGVALPAKRRAWPVLLLTVAFAVIGLGAALGWLAWQRRGTSGAPAPAREIRQRQLTANPEDSSLNDAAISPDGKYLAYSDATGLHLLSIETGESRSLPASDATSLGEIRWFPDGTRLLLTSNAEQKNSIWSYSIMSGTTRKLRDDADGPSVSPDGSLIAFNDPDYRGIWVMGATGEEPRRIVTVEKGDNAYSPAWSPDSRRISYMADHRKKEGGSDSALQSTDAQGRQTTLILSVPKGSSVDSFCWIAGGRVIYSLSGSDPSVRDDSLWEIKVDSLSGRAEGLPRKLASAAGFSWSNLSAPSDGKRLAYLRSRWQSDVYVGELEANGTSLKTPRRLTLDDRFDAPGAWTPDSRSVLFSSNRNGTFDIFKQDLDGRSADAVLASPNDEYSPMVTPDGASLLFWQTLAADRDKKGLKRTLMRLSLSGGPPQMVFDPRTDHRPDVFYYARCAASGCILSEQIEEKEIIFWALDPSRGKGRELGRIDIQKWTYYWDISPDGSNVAIVEFPGRIRTRSLSERTTRDLPVKGLGRLQSASWSRDGKTLFVTGWSGAESGLLSVDLKSGETTVLWKHLGWVYKPLPSPDGRHIALQVASGDTNAWLLENF